MFSVIRKMVNQISVSEDGWYVTISGIDGYMLSDLIYKKWRTNKIGNNFFSTISSSKLVIVKFFVPDLIYTLTEIIEDKKIRKRISILEDIREKLYENTWIKSTLKEPKPILDRSKLDLFYKKPLQHQSEFFDTYEKNTQQYHLNGYLLAAVPGSGKAQPLDTKLLTKDGFILMRDVKVGDILLDRLLKPTTVTGVFPQGKKRVFEVIFEDGRKTRSCIEHLWTVTVNNERKTLSLMEVQELMVNGKEVFIDLPKLNSLSCGLTTSSLVAKNEKLLEDVINQYRSKGALVTVKSNTDNYKLNIEFRANHLIKLKEIKKSTIEEVQCIKVDNEESLYLCDDYVVTHNTLSSLMLSRMLNTDTNIFLVPKNSLDRVWRASLDTEIKGESNYWISNSDKPITTGYKDYVIHHDHLIKVLDFFKENKNSFGKVYINLDESHFFNEIKSKRTNYLVELSRDILESENTLFMSGTPLKAIGAEVIPLLRCIDPYFNNIAEDRFYNIYGRSYSRANDILKHRMGYMTFKVEKAESVGNIVNLFNGYVKSKDGEKFTLKHIKDVMKKYVNERMDYYNRNMSKYTDIYFSILKNFESTLSTANQLREFKDYNEAVTLIRKNYDPVARKDDIIFTNKYEKDIIRPTLTGEEKKIFDNVKSIYKYYFLKVQGEALGNILGKQRVEAILSMLPSLNKIEIKDENGKVTSETSLDDEILSTKKKTVIFTSYVEVAKQTVELLENQGYKPLLVYGGTNKELADIVRRFETDPDANPLVATFKSLSTAVPLIMANVTIMLNAPFRDYEFQQALSRTDRIGQDSEVYCTTLYLDTGNEDNITTRAKDIMEWSRTQIEEIMGVKMDPSIAIEDNKEDSNEEKSEMLDPFESLAEKLDIGVDYITGEDSLFETNGENESISIRLKNKWSQW